MREKEREREREREKKRERGARPQGHNIGARPQYRCTASILVRGHKATI